MGLLMKLSLSDFTSLTWSAKYLLIYSGLSTMRHNLVYPSKFLVEKLGIVIFIFTIESRMCLIKSLEVGGAGKLSNKVEWSESSRLMKIISLERALWRGVKLLLR